MLSFSDVRDEMGLYLDLSKYTFSENLPFNTDELIKTAKKLQKEMDFGNASKIKKTFSDMAAIIAVVNELKNIYKHGRTNHYTVMPVNNNIYNLRIIFQKDFFNKSSKIYSDMVTYDKPIELDILIDGKLYPFYPPKLRLISPRLTNNLNERVSTMECLFISNWNPQNDILLLIDHIRNLLNENGGIDTDFEYDELESDLIDLSLLTEIPSRTSSITMGKKNTIVVSQTKTDKYWEKGVGYSHGASNEWDLEATNKALNERDKQLSKCIKNITRRLTKIIINDLEIDSVNMLERSCFVPFLKSVFRGNSILELSKIQNISNY